MIGDGLVRAGFIDQRQMDKVLAKQRAGDARRFGEIAIALDFLSDDEMMRYLAMWARGESDAASAVAGPEPAGD